MAKELHSDDIQIEQKPTLVLKGKGARRQVNQDGDLEVDDTEKNVGDVVRADPKIMSKEYLAELQFMREPVVVRLEPSTDKNAATVFPVWVNGKGAEMIVDGQWREVTYLPVGVNITIRRSVLEIIVRAKIDTIQTDIVENPGQDPENRIRRFTSALHSFSIIEDRNPRGQAWLMELRRRNY